MKTLYIKSSIFVVVLMVMTTAKAQDFHLSQYDNSLQHINPAYTGFGIDKDYRVNMNHRTQWGSIMSRPFRSFLFSYDQKINEQFNAGGYILSNNAGDNNVNSLNVMLSGSYNIIQSVSSPHKLTTGLQLGLFHRNISAEDYIYDSQYDGSSGNFDSSIDSQESFQGMAFNRFEAGLGMYYQYVDDNTMFNPFGGLSLQHVSFPNESFTERWFNLPLRWVVHTGTNVKLNEEFSVMPNILFMYQRKAYDFNMGLMGQYNIKDTDYSVMLGANYRWKDAVIIHTGFKYKSNIIRISYDVNTSYLKNYTGGRGALEFSIVFVGGFNETVQLFRPSL